MISVVLSMIVKDEAPVIGRFLESCRSFVDTYMIVDTGSTDGTQQIVLDFLKLHGCEGGISEQPWVNFAHNRNEALELARPHGDYVFLPLAADLEVVVEDPALKTKLEHPVYMLKRRHGIMEYWNTGLVRSDVPAQYVGVTHEYLDSTPPAQLDGLWLNYHGDGPERLGRYAENVRLLTAALEDPALDLLLRARYEFYLAQSYRDLGQAAPALLHYAKRARLGHWDQEVYLCHYYSGLLLEEQGHVDLAVASYHRATELRPERNEARWALTKLLRSQGCYAQALRAGLPGVGLPVPAGLFVLPWVYEHGLADELKLTAETL